MTSPTETLRFDIVGNDKASPAFKRSADTSELAARGARTLAVALERQKKAADVSAGATLALAKADKILEDAEHGLNDELLKQEFLQKKATDAQKSATAEAKKAAAEAKKAGLGGSGGSGGFFDRGVVGGAGPGIGRLNAKWAALLGLGGAGLGAIPALGAIAAGSALGGAGLGVVSAGANLLIGDKKNPGELFKPAQQALKTLQSTFKDAAQGLAKPLEEAFKSLPGILHDLAPALHQLFAGAGALIKPVLTGLAGLAKAVLPQLGQAFRALGPLLGTALRGFAQLASGLLPGIVTLLKSAQPAFNALASVLGTVGGALGDMFKSFAPVIKQSSLIFKSLGDVVAAIFPIVGKLAAVFASALAPVFADLSGIIKSLLPVLLIVGRVIADLAKAVLSDLGSAFGAIASLIKSVSPALAVLAAALKGVFDVLENSGVFAVLGDALEKVTPLLGKLITALITGLAPILPPVIKLVSALSTTAINLLTTGLQVLIPIAIQLVNDVLKPLLPALNAIIPVVTTIARALGTGLGAVLKAIAPILSKIAPYVLAIVGAVKAWAIAQGVLDIALDANPIGLIAIAVAGLIVGITLLVTHWKQVWTDIKHWAQDAWQFLTHGWGQVIIPGLTLIRVTIEFVRDHWKDAWNAIVNAFKTAVGFVRRIFADWITMILNSFGTIIHAAASAFGWIPGIGPKLQAASRAFDSWAHHVESTISGINPKPVQIPFVATLPNGKQIGNFAAGTPAAAPGWAWVGEQGPELMNMRGGEIIIPNHALRGYATGAGAFGFSQTLPSIAHLAAAFTKGAHIIGEKIASKIATLIPVSGNPSGGSAAAVQALARRIFPWPASQWPAYNAVEMREAGYNLTAQNPTSGAYGLAQFINGPSEYFQYGGSPFTAIGQLTGMFNYIRQRYGTPSAAWGHELSFGWYDRGGTLRPGLNLMYNGTGRPEHLVRADQPRAVVLEVRAHAGGIDQFLAEMIKRYVRVAGGGDVQVAFGRD